MAAADMTLDLAVERSLLPLRMKGLSLGLGGPDMLLRELDDALSAVVSQGFSRSALRHYLSENVYLCLSDGTWHPTSRALKKHLRTPYAMVNRELVKKFRFARLLLVGGRKQVGLPQNHIRLSDSALQPIILSGIFERR